MSPLITAILLIVAAGVASGILNFFSKKIASIIGIWGIGAGCIVGLSCSIGSLAYQARSELLLPLPFSHHYLTFYLDPLSNFFLILVFGLSLLCAIYGNEYLKVHGNHNKMWFTYSLLAASMAMVTIAGDAISFLVFWEMMALSSFFLVASEWEDKKSSRASWIYLSFTQIGTAALLVFFLYLWKAAGAPDFDSFKALQLGGAANFLFVLALIGFGSKAGIIPFHIWLPEAHPAAPTHVSALMSGVMIKIGIYGLLRAFSFLGPPDFMWGALLIVIGAVSGILGVLLAIAQHDIKRLLAYHSVENIGIIILGIGIGVIGVATSSPVLATLGFAGGLLHVCNHALFKSLLFMSAGSAILKTNTREINYMGGLIKVLPLTALAFLIGSLSISGIPPFNGFVSEFLIYAASFLGLQEQSVRCVLLLMAAILSLSLIGGLALLCFTKAFGIIFLGEPRRISTSDLSENRWGITIPMIFLALLCMVIGIAPVIFLPLIATPLQALLGTHAADMYQYPRLASFMGNLTIATLSFSAVFLLLLIGRKFLSRGKTVQPGITWDCGFIKPSPRLQYTASSFAYPILEYFARVLRTRKQGPDISDYFPNKVSLSAHTVDFAESLGYAPFYRFMKKLSNNVFNATRREDSLGKTLYASIRKVLESACWLVRRLQRAGLLLLKAIRARLVAITAIQQGDMRIYLLYIIVVLCVLLVFAGKI